MWFQKCLSVSFWGVINYWSGVVQIYTKPDYIKVDGQVFLSNFINKLFIKNLNLYQTLFCLLKNLRLRVPSKMNKNIFIGLILQNCLTHLFHTPQTPEGLTTDLQDIRKRAETL